MPVTPTFVNPTGNNLVSGSQINMSKVLDFDKATQSTKRRDITPGSSNDGASLPAIVFNFEDQQGSRYWVYSNAENRDAAYAALLAAVADSISGNT